MEPPVPLSGRNEVARINTKMIDANRRLTAENTIESPYNAVFDDSEADYIERLYDQLPPDKVGFLPPGTDE